ncbi:MAG: CYTH domain-containing protein [Myxococcales bacterium]|nr:CYTH domain-containing protein [Myxococcales bacterium]
MSQEHELKFALEDETDYERLSASLGAPHERLEQRNFYLDSPGGRLRGARVMLRVRVTQTSSVLALKRQLARPEDGYFRMYEEEVELHHPWRGDLEVLAQIPLVTQLAHDLGIECLVVVGEMQNLRLCYPRESFLLELDRTLFPDGSVDFEIEAETDEPAVVADEIAMLCASAGARFRPQTLSKFQRFLQRLKG